MTQAPYVEDKANLPVGVYMVPTYSELWDGSQSVAVVLHNLMGKLVHLQAGRVIAWMVAGNMVPEGKPTPELIKKLEEHDPELAPQKLMIGERQKLLMELLQQEDGLDQWRGILPVCSEYVKCSRSSRICLYGECLLTSCERVIQTNTTNSFCFDTIRLDALLQW